MKSTKILLVVLIGVVLVAGGVLAYYQVKVTELENEVGNTNVVAGNTNAVVGNVNTAAVNTATNAVVNSAVIGSSNTSGKSTCTTSTGSSGFVMSDGKCYAPGQGIPNTDCKVTSTGGCEGMDPYADWKTYSNTKYEYSFKYPNDWTLGDSPSTLTPSLTADDVAFDGSVYVGSRFGVRVVVASGCTTLRVCTEANRLSFGTGEQTSGLSESTVGGKTALIETITRPTSGNWKYYVKYILNQGNIYRIYTISKATDDIGIKATFDQILSSFTFTN